VSTLGGFKGNPRDALEFLNAALAPDSVAYHHRNLPRLPIDDRADALTTQVMTSVPIWLNAGETVTSISAISGTTAAGTPTNCFFALYSNAATPALLGQSADQTTAAWAADTVRTLALTTPVKITKAGLYWVGLMVKATTVPSLLGAVGAKPVLTGEPALANTSGSALTATAPATIASPAAQRAVPLVYVS
jgi:hypothetical protein